MTTLIQAGMIITASETFQADILIEGEKIEKIGKNLTKPEDALVINARGKMVLPGGVDVHTHFDLPMSATVSSDDHYTGHKAAAFWWHQLTVIDLFLRTRIHYRKMWMHGMLRRIEKAAVDFGFHMNITRFDEKIALEISWVAQQGISSLKVFTAYNHRLRLQDARYSKYCVFARQNGMLVMAHCENGDVIDILVKEALQRGDMAPIWHARTRPAWGEIETILRMISLSAQAEAMVYIVHMTTSGGVNQVQRARQNGWL